MRENQKQESLAEARSVERQLRDAKKRGWKEWDRDGRKDGVRSFDFRPSDRIGWRVHVEDGTGTVVSTGGATWTLGSFPVSEAFQRAEEQAREQAEGLLQTASDQVRDAELALAALTLSHGARSATPKGASDA